MRATHSLFAPRELRLAWWQRPFRVSLLPLVAWLILGGIGTAALYSVSEASWEPYALRHLVRLGAATALLFAVVSVDLRRWLALAYPAYAAVLLLLVAVEFIGVVGKGGQRWLDLGVMHIQPSELMKVTLVLALARYFHARHVWTTQQLLTLVPPALMTLAPAALVASQPDLGTAAILVMIGVVVIFLAGARRLVFIVGFAAFLVALPVIWTNLHDYQRERVETFLDPERDPLGAGYQIIQSKIALGSAGVWGKGWLKGTQSHLKFLPEMKTDFILAAFAEEFGLMGALVVLGLYGIIIGFGLTVGLACRNHFGRLLAAGLGFAVFTYVFINVGMVTGLLPVVGVPLPLLSYGGSAMFTLAIALGLMLVVGIERERVIPRLAT
ncbi:MAG: rod shape-determining protein RodA [Rhodothalassiaceae bacterium]|nr:MAG: rod shape-determining protein RodA [Rhodothalassiaceae bacterium]